VRAGDPQLRPLHLLRDALPQAGDRKELSSVDAVVLGIGNPWRRDDGAGPAVARRLAGRLPETVRLQAVGGEITELVEAFRGVHLAILIDAVSSGDDPGTIHRFDATTTPLPAHFGRLSSHGIGLAEAIELARTLGGLPHGVHVYGIEGADWSPGQGLSPAVERAVARVTAELIGLLAAPDWAVLPA
jgi:hydrogenase maturation protease